MSNEDDMLTRFPNTPAVATICYTVRSCPNLRLYKLLYIYISLLRSICHLGKYKFRGTISLLSMYIIHLIDTSCKLIIYLTFDYVRNIKIY